jgi:hypothetical protein
MELAELDFPYDASTGNAEELRRFFADRNGARKLRMRPGSSRLQIT